MEEEIAVKKIAVVLVLIAALVGAGIGGLVYAAGLHQPTTGNRLSGTAAFGIAVTSENQGTQVVVENPVFMVTNTDCLNSVTIEQLSIVRADGLVIYEGPFLQALPYTDNIYMDWSVVNRVQVTTLAPHRQLAVQLWALFRDGSGNWLDCEDTLTSSPMSAYTVEVFWTGGQSASSLAGTVTTQQVVLLFDAGSNEISREQSSNRTDMVSLTPTVDAPPPVPTLVYPVNGRVTNDDTPWLDWTDVTDDTQVHYQLQVDNDADFSSPAVNKTWVNLSSNTQSTLPDGVYYWRVRAVDAGGNPSAWTSGWSFTVVT
jgi:hypothetical protein